MLKRRACAKVSDGRDGYRSRLTFAARRTVFTPPSSSLTLKVAAFIPAVAEAHTRNPSALSVSMSSLVVKHFTLVCFLKCGSSDHTPSHRTDRAIAR